MRQQRGVADIAVSVRPARTRAGLDSGAEQLRLGGGELVVGQHALLVQRGQLVELTDHVRRLGWSRGRGRRWLLIRRRRLLLLVTLLLVTLLLVTLLLVTLLLFQIADALVLIRLVLGLLLLLPGHMLAGHVRATANRRCTQQRTPSEHHCLLAKSAKSCLGLYIVREGQAESHHELGRGRDDPGPADLRGHGDQHADE